MLNGGSYVSSENGVLKGVSGVIVQSGEVHITNGGTINSDGSWRSYGVELRGGAYGTIVNTGTIITRPAMVQTRSRMRRFMPIPLMISRRAILFLLIIAAFCSLILLPLRCTTARILKCSTALAG
ncbi:ShdA [Salmonella enterica subsp. enterica]|nr:ShdA [Salmonella enterica subsp. enterica] [Salmonella enterica subsp. enterica serovar Menston]